MTFNGHKCERGPKNINLALNGDIISNTFSIKDRYRMLGPGGHGLSDFKDFINKDDTWIELLGRPAVKGKKSQCSIM